MAINEEAYQIITTELAQKQVQLIAVSKTKTAADITALYDLGQRDFGENYVQEITEKQQQLPADIRWHFIGHLQSNKVKYIAPFVSLIHGVDSLKLLQEINKQAIKNNRIIDCLLQVYIAKEETKFGLDAVELNTIIEVYKTGVLPNIQLRGLMGMASNTTDKATIKTEFNELKEVFDTISNQLTTFNILSMGMSSDYHIAIDAGGNMVRIGSLLFGERNYTKN
jgi:pyridoxal phosphate enzyme (YggS family)